MQSAVQGITVSLRSRERYVAPLSAVYKYEENIKNSLKMQVPMAISRPMTAGGTKALFV